MSKIQIRSPVSESLGLSQIVSGGGDGVPLARFADATDAGSESQSRQSPVLPQFICVAATFEVVLRYGAYSTASYFLSPIPDISGRLRQLPRPPRQDRRLLILFILVNAALIGAAGIAYLVHTWLEALPRR
jgi:hypothetical protein